MTVISHFRFVLFSFVVLSSSLAASDGYWGGIQINEADHQIWAHCLKKQGMNTVSVTVYAQQGDWDTDHIWFNEEEPSVLSEIRVTKESGLKVVLIPRVALDHAFPRNAALWHGMIMPRTDEQVRNWFKTYTDYLVKWAKIAEEEKVDVLAVGSELKALTHTMPNSLENTSEEAENFQYWYESFPERILDAHGDEAKREAYHQKVTQVSQSHLQWAEQIYGAEKSADGNKRNSKLKAEEQRIQELQARRGLLLSEWKKLIAEVRKHYSGPLTYASNFDAYQNNLLWPELDLMGINAYFKLRHTLGPMIRDDLEMTLDASWGKIFAGIRKFRKALKIEDQPLIFTELGYTFFENATVEPWSYGGTSVVESGQLNYLVDWESQQPNFVERSEAMESLQRTVGLPENDFFHGLLYWKFSTDPRHYAVERFMIYIGPGSTESALDSIRKMAQQQ
ncbi:MAG: hypothetical protein AAFY98_08855 [Verrucomicrobiota bacterium]